MSQPIKSSTPARSSELFINIQPKQSSKNKILFIAYLSTGKFKNEKVREIQGAKEEEDETTGGKIMVPVYGTTEKKKFERVKVSTSISVPLAYWDSDKKICKKPYQHLNDELKDFKTYVQELYQSLVKSNIEITAQLLQDKVKEYIVKQLKKINKQKSSKQVEEKEKISVSIPSYFGKEFNGIETDLIKYVENKIALYTNQGYYISKKGKSTLTKYRTFISHLERYYKATKINLDLLTLDIDACRAFVQWLVDNGKSEKQGGGSFKHNYLTEIKKELKGFILKAKVNKIPVPIDIEEELEDEFWDLSWEKENDPYLTFEHLAKLKALKFDDEQKKQNLELVRDAFIVGCACGASIQDLLEIKHIFNNPMDGWYFLYIREKINKGKVLNIKIKIPIRDKYIIDLYKNKYKEEFKFKISDAKFNKHIKTVCLLAGLKEPVEKSTKNTKTGKLDRTTTKLWQEVSSKTMRKTFASNEVRVYLTPLSVLKRWTNHKSEDMLMNYIQLSEDDYFNIAIRLQAKLLNN